MNKIIFTLLISLTIVSCGGMRSFHEYARAGDTIAVPVGMQPTFSKDNITVTITPSTGAPIVLAATNPAIRAIINLYPDPLSSMIVSREIDFDLTENARTYEMTTQYTANQDKDWYQTTVFVDLPVTLPTGETTIVVDDGSGSTSNIIVVDIISGTGSANTFLAEASGAIFQLSDTMMDALSRVSHTKVSIASTSIIPHAIEMNFIHDTDASPAGGDGEAFVINPLGYKKNLVWNDDGTELKVILTQSRDGIIDNMNDYKFYITGTATNIQLVSVEGYDNNGNVIANITGTLN